MSIDYDNRERQFDADIEASFGSLAALVAVEVEDIRNLVVQAYKADLVAFDDKTRLLDDIVAITQIGDGDADEASKYRKIRQALASKGLVEN